MLDGLRTSHDVYFIIDYEHEPNYRINTYLKLFVYKFSTEIRISKENFEGPEKY